MLYLSFFKNMKPESLGFLVPQTILAPNSLPSWATGSLLQAGRQPYGKEVPREGLTSESRSTGQ